MKDEKGRFIKQRFCQAGHDKTIVGVNNSRYCRLCSKQKQWKRRQITGFTKVQYDYMYQIQQGCCKICNKHQSKLKQTLNVDHDHKTGKVRGLLCTYCNVGLGIYENKKAIFDKYLNG